MCGIAGIASINPVDAYEEGFQKGMRKIAHRGPDGEGAYRGRHCLLGHRRLKIIDLSDYAAQPMVDDNKRYVISYNGEVYNFKEIKKDLQKAGVCFKSQSDTEVVLHAYMHWGAKCLEHFVGMFAFAIWDNQKNTLFLARDRIGQKPLFIKKMDDGIAFASELPALRAMVNHTRKINPEALWDYLHWQGVLAPRTMYEGFERLEAGTYLVYQNGTYKHQVYWDMENHPKSTDPANCESDYIRDQIRYSVQSQLIADVPVGVFLSGGVDSSIMAYLAKSEGSHIRRHAFSIGFQDPQYDESLEAESFAAKHDLVFHREQLDDHCLLEMDHIQEHFGEPFADSSILPSLAVSKLARRNVTVAINGDGGDELFGGYPKYQWLLARNKFEKIPGHRFIGKFLASIPQFRRIVDQPELSAFDYYHQWPGHFSYASLKKHLRPEWRDADRMLKWYRSHLVDSVESAMKWDLKNYVGSILLHKMDIASMKYGLEVRSPFLDHSLIEMSFHIPLSRKLMVFDRKIILRTAFAKELGDPLFKKKKRGFAIPIKHWVTLWTKRKPELLDFKSLRVFFETLPQFSELNDLQRWNLLCLEQWGLQHI